MWVFPPEYFSISDFVGLFFQLCSFFVHFFKLSGIDIRWVTVLHAN